MKHYYKKTLLFSSLILCSLFVKGQFEFLDPCFSESIFTEEVYAKTDIKKYSHSYSDISARNSIDLYTPSRGNNCRPLVLIIGGGFFVDVDVNGMTEYAKYFAQRGYLAAVINHRVVKEEERCSDLGWWQGIQDVNAAIKYVSALSDMYDWARFNNQKVILVGSSAGGVAALTLTFSSTPDMINYLPRGHQFFGGLNHSVFPPYLHAPYNIIGAVSLAGGMPSIINANGYEFNETASVLFIHSTDDKIIPYNKGKAGTCVDMPNSRTLYGPKELSKKIKNSAFPVEQIILQGRQHVIPIKDHITEINSFIYKISIASEKSTNTSFYSTNTPKKSSPYGSKLYIYPNPSDGKFKIKIPYNDEKQHELNSRFNDFFFDEYLYDISLFSIDQGSQTGLTVIQVVDLSGTVVHTFAKQNSYAGNDILDVKANIPAGTYILRINIEGVISTERIIITN